MITENIPHPITTGNYNIEYGIEPRLTPSEIDHSKINHSEINHSEIDPPHKNSQHTALFYLYCPSPHFIFSTSEEVLQTESLVSVDNDFSKRTIK